jgi:hypothetical protein
MASNTLHKRHGHENGHGPELKTDEAQRSSLVLRAVIKVDKSVEKNGYRVLPVAETAVRANAQAMDYLVADTTPAPAPVPAELTPAPVAAQYPAPEELAAPAPAEAVSDTLNAAAVLEAARAEAVSSVDTIAASELLHGQAADSEADYAGAGR